MHNIVLHITIYLFPWLHVLCDLSPINNARKHAISAIFKSMFFFITLIFDRWSVLICVAIIKNDTAHHGRQYTDLYSHLFFLNDHQNIS